MLKRFLFVISILLSLPTKMVACDICGCGVGSYYIGILPDFNKRFIGLRYQHKSLLMHLTPGGGRSYLTTEERYHSAELWGAWNIGKRFRVMYLLPYNLIERTNQGSHTSKSGMGDVAINGYYHLLQKEFTNNRYKRVIQSLWVGGGVKLPTGKYNSADKNEVSQQLNTFQLGSGSTDFSIHAMYDLRVQDAGINVNASYKINTSNRDQYYYGNKISTMLLGYYKFSLQDELTLSPNAGVLYEKSAKDFDKGSIDISTGGSSIMGAVGIEWTIKRVGIGANYQVPLHQRLGNGTVKTNDRLMGHVSFSF